MAQAYVSQHTHTPPSESIVSRDFPLTPLFFQASPGSPGTGRTDGTGRGAPPGHTDSRASPGPLVPPATTATATPPPATSRPDSRRWTQTSRAPGTTERTLWEETHTRSQKRNASTNQDDDDDNNNSNNRETDLRSTQHSPGEFLLTPINR